jgi:hypothetical protein
MFPLQAGGSGFRYKPDLASPTFPFGSQAGVVQGPGLIPRLADHTITGSIAPDLAPLNPPKWWLAPANPAWTNDLAAQISP